MVEGAYGASLLLEAAPALGIARGFRADELDRRLAPQALIEGAVDLSHPPGPQEGEDFEGTNPCPGGEWHGPSRRRGEYSGGGSE